MRLIDAEQCPCNECVPPTGDSRGCSIFPCREFCEWYETTAYDVSKVIKRLHYAKNPYSDLNLVQYNNALDLAIRIVERGGEWCDI